MMADNWWEQDKIASTVPEKWWEQDKPVPPPGPATGAQTPSGLESLGRGAVSGATLNFGDEGAGIIAASPLTGSGAEFSSPIANMALGAGRLLWEKATGQPTLSGLITGDQRGPAQKAYDEAVARERAANEAAQRANPGTYFTGQLLGGLATAPVAPGLAPFKAAQGAGLLARTGAAAGNLAATGAAYGTVAGAGGAEGGVGDRALGAVQGALEGAVAGPVVGGLASGLAKAGGTVADHIAAWRDPQRLGDRILGRAFEGDTANTEAIAKAIEADQLQKYGPLPETFAVVNGVPHTVDPKSGTLTPLPETNPGAVQNITAADIAGPNTRAAAANAVRMPGPARGEGQRFLDERQAGSPSDSPLNLSSQADRIAGKLTEAAGADKGSLAEADRILAKRSEEGDQLYKAPMSSAIDYASPEGKALAGLFDRIPSQAKAAAERILGMEGKRPAAAGAVPEPATPPPTIAQRSVVVRDLLKSGQRLDELDPVRVDRAANLLARGEAQDGATAYEAASAIPKQATQLTPQHWDYLKQGLDKIVSANTDKFGRLDSVGNAANALRKEVVAATEAAVPGLKEARSVWRGHSEELGALRAGENAFSPNKTVEQLNRDMADLSQTGKDLYRLSAFNKLKSQIGNRGDFNNKARLVSGSQGLRQKLQALAPDRKTYNDMLAYLSREENMFRTRSAVTGNSASVERLADALDAERPGEMVKALHAAKKLATGNVLGALHTAIGILGKVNPEQRARVLDEVRKVVLNPDPAAVRAFQERMSQQSALPTPMRTHITKLVLQAVPRAITTQATERRSREPAH